MFGILGPSVADSGARVLMPGDRIEIRCDQDQSLSVVRQISEDGTGDLPVVGSVGGAINIITNPATLNGFSAESQLEVGNYDLRHVVAVQNLPMSDTFFLRMAVAVTSRLSANWLLVRSSTT